MSLLKYVKKISATKHGLSTPGGSLDGVLPPEAIRSANEFVRTLDYFKSSYKEEREGSNTLSRI